MYKVTPPLRTPPPPPLPPPLPLQVLFALNQTLLQHEGVRAGSLQGSYTTEDLITHYNCGDLNSIIFNHDTSQVSFQATSFSQEGGRCQKKLIALFSFSRQSLLSVRLL